MQVQELFKDKKNLGQSLIHLADVLELADPRRKLAQASRTKIKRAGLHLPTRQTVKEWRASCRDVVNQLEVLRSTVQSAQALAQLDAAIDRIRLMIE